MTIQEALKAAAVEGVSARVNTFDGGTFVQLVLPGTSGFLRTYYWGDEDKAVADINAFVAEHRQRREDDPRVQHEPVVEERY